MIYNSMQISIEFYDLTTLRFRHERIWQIWLDRYIGFWSSSCVKLESIYESVLCICGVWTEELGSGKAFFRFFKILYFLPQNFRNTIMWQPMATIAEISNALTFKTLMSASTFVSKVGKSNSFDSCSGCSKVYLVWFFIFSVDFCIKNAPPNWHASTLVYWQLRNFIIKQVKFNTNLHPIEHPQRMCWCLAS